MVKWFKSLFKKDSTPVERVGPWASFEINGFSDDGRIKIDMDWNQEFIDKINELGFRAETEQDSVQLFFYTAQMRPTSLAGDAPDLDPVQSLEHPSLSRQTNILKE